METIPERVEPDPLELEHRSLSHDATRLQTRERRHGALDLFGPDAAAIDEPLARRAARRGRTYALTVSRQHVLALLAIYFLTRGILLLTAYLLSSFGHYNFLHELANWDGLWYRKLANHGYPSYPSYKQTTLGFFPLYPIAIWILEPVFSVISGHGASWYATIAGVVISTFGGAVATYYIYRLATDWWDRKVAFRATVLFIVFPGSVVFSMVYSEGLLLPLAAACLFYLGRRRWLLAGVLAGIATAVQPVAIALIPACAIAALLELRRRGWTRRAVRQVISAPLLSLTGISAFALFLWFWTGTPFANYEAQHHGWSEKTNLLAIVHLTTTMIKGFEHKIPHATTVNWNLVVGLVGAFLLVAMLVLVYRERRRIPPAALVWTAGVSWLALTSQYVPPNPRMLITAFPALMVVARYARGKWWSLLLWSNCILLVVLSVLTFHGVTLRP